VIDSNKFRNEGQALVLYPIHESQVSSSVCYGENIAFHCSTKLLCTISHSPTANSLFSTDESDHARGDLYYVGIPVDSGREVQMEHAQLEVFDHDTILPALQCVAIQRVEKCAICRDRMELKVFAKTSGPALVID
jgi:hypothetical protein